MPKPTKNPGVISFVAQIEQSDAVTNSWAWVAFPYDLKDLYGIGNLVPVTITYDNLSYQGSITKMGGPHPMLLIKRDILASLGKTRGDSVKVTVTLDDKPRSVDVPLELSDKLNNNPAAKKIYNKLAYSHRLEYANWVREAKLAETRQNRANKAIEQILGKG